MRGGLFSSVVHLLYPTRCPVCGEVIGKSERFCSECANSLTPFGGSFNIKGAESFSAAFEYNVKVSPAIILLKRGVCGNADYALGSALADVLRENGIAKKADVIVPVPMYRSDKRRRGYNQSALIARVMSNELDIPLAEKAVEKQRLTARQKELTRDERAVNLKNAFEVTLPQNIRGKQVLLIDDVCTTGATMSEITEILLKSGAAAVHCASCCKTPMKGT